MGLTRPRAYQIFDIDYKQSVRVISTTNVTLAGGAPSSVDGVSLSAGDRILVTGQSTGSQNGLYQVSVLGTGSDGTWIRSVDANQQGEIDAGMIVMVTEGEVYKDTQWKLTTNDPITLDVTPLVFEQNSAFAFGNIYANGTAVLADIVGDTVTFTPANNLIITGNATSDTITFEVSQSPDFTGNFVVSGTVGSNLIPTANVTYNLGNSTNRWNDIWLSNSTIYLGNAEISANSTAITITNPAGGTTVLSGTTPAVEADTVTATGNITGGNLITSGTLSVTGNANTGNLGATTVVATNLTGTLTTAAQPNVTSVGTLTSLSVTGNVTGGNLITSGELNTNNFVISGNVTGNLLPSANVTYNLGSPTQRWNEIFLAGNTIDIGGATISADLVTGSLILTGPDGAEFILSGSDADNALGAFGFVSAGNTEPAISTTTGAITSAGGLGVAGNIYAGGLVEVTGNITSGNLVTAGQVTATGNITAGNVTTSGNITADYFFGNVSQASGIFTTKIFNGTSEANIVSSGGNLEISIGGTSDIVVVSSAGLETTGTLQATGNVTGGNIVTTGQVVATGNVTGGNLSGTNIAGTLTTAAQPNITSVGTLTSLSVTGNVDSGNVSGTRGAFTNIAGTLETASQPNITSLGTLTSLNVSGNAVIGGDLTVNGNTIYVNITDLNVQDPIIGLGRGENNAPLTSDDGKDRGEQLWYYTSAEKSAFIGYDNSADKLIAALDVSVSGEIVTVNSYGNFVVGGLEAATGSFTGNITGGNLATAGQVTATGNITGGNLKTSAVTIGSTGAISGVTTISASGNANVGNLGAAAGVFTGAVTGSTTITATGNVTGGNLVTAGQVSATGNVTGNFFNGNGSALTGINSFGTIVVAGSDNVVADSTSDTLTLVAGDGVVITTAAGTDTITISTSGSGDSIFLTGGDMGTVEEAVTSEEDLGLITDLTALEYDLGTIVTAGIFYPDQIVFPSYTVAQLSSLSAAPAGQMVYCSNESGGAVPAFSDGTNWRRVTDRAIVT